MDSQTFVEVLKIAAPVVSSFLTVLGGLIALVRAIKLLRKESEADRKLSEERLANLERKIGETNTKVKSIEKHLLEKERR